LANLLITGGAGFIGSHTCLVLLEAGHRLVVLDNFANSSPESLRRVQVFGGDWSTPDGSGVRDDIPVMDLADPCLAEMCRDGWAWQSANPNGYAA